MLFVGAADILADVCVPRVPVRWVPIRVGVEVERPCKGRNAKGGDTFDDDVKDVGAAATLDA